MVSEGESTGDWNRGSEQQMNAEAAEDSHLKQDAEIRFKKVSVL